MRRTITDQCTLVLSFFPVGRSPWVCSFFLMKRDSGEMVSGLCVAPQTPAFNLYLDGPLPSAPICGRVVLCCPSPRGLIGVVCCPDFLSTRLLTVPTTFLFSDPRSPAGIPPVAAGQLQVTLGWVACGFLSHVSRHPSGFFPPASQSTCLRTTICSRV